MELSKELKKKALKCKTAEELVALANENGVELEEDDAKQYLNYANEGELSDSELESVSGGRACKRNAYEEVHWENPNEVQFIFNCDDIIQVFKDGLVGSHTVTVKITGRDPMQFDDTDLWRDEYFCEHVDGPWIKKYVPRSRIEK